MEVSIVAMLIFPHYNYQEISVTGRPVRIGKWVGVSIHNMYWDRILTILLLDSKYYVFTAELFAVNMKVWLSNGPMFRIINYKLNHLKHHLYQNAIVLKVDIKWNGKINYFIMRHLSFQFSVKNGNRLSWEFLKFEIKEFDDLVPDVTSK